jgi:hypothetical protein
VKWADYGVASDDTLGERPRLMRTLGIESVDDTVTQNGTTRLCGR